MAVIRLITNGNYILIDPKSWYVQKNVGSDLELKLFCSII